MKKVTLLSAALFGLSIMTGCGKKGPTVSIVYEGEEGTAAFAIDEIKKSFERNNIRFTDGKADYTITIKEDSAQYDEQAYGITVSGKNITITGGDRVGLMYGGLELAEMINLDNGIEKIQDFSESPYTEFRGISCRPPMDLRTPSYTNNGDSTRWNLENTWDLDYWKGLFDIMAKMRYNLLSFATVNCLPHMVIVPGYENCALNDVYEYTGEYDDTYLGNCTNMYRDEHFLEENRRLVKTMTINEKIDFWKEVMDYAYDRGITWQFSTMNIYTFSETAFSNYGITADRDNPVTKDYFMKAYQTLLETYPHIDQIKTTCGENMDYPAEEEAITNQWYRDVYGKACENVLSKDKERADRFILGFAGIGNTLLTDNFYSAFSDYPYQLSVNKRYNDTRLFSVTKCTDNDEYINNMPDGWDMIFNVRAEDCYHLTWANPSWAREWCRNVKKNRVRGWHFAIDGYYVSGKEYEFVDTSLNGDYYYNRHWMMYSMFGRMGYNPDISDETWGKIVLDHYEDVDDSIVKSTYESMNIASNIMPNVICQYSPSGTDAAFLPEMCLSNPTLFGFFDIKRFVNSDQADPDGDIMSFAEYAKALERGETTFSKRTPFEVADELRSLSQRTLDIVNPTLEKIGETNAEIKNLLLDQKCFALIGHYYAQKFEAGMNLRLYNDTEDKNYQDKAITALQIGVGVWKEYAALYTSRFIKERLPRHGLIDPNSYTAIVEKDISIVQKWVKRNY